VALMMPHKGDNSLDQAGGGRASQRISQIMQRLADLQARLPAHSIPPAMVMEIEALEEELEQLQSEAEKREE